MTTQTAIGPEVFAAQRHTEPPRSHVSLPVAQTLNSLNETRAFLTGDRETQPRTSYGPQEPDDDRPIIGPATNVTAPPIRNRFSLDALQQITLGIQAAQQREAERRARARPKPRPQPQQMVLEQGPWPTYDGLDETCPICLQTYQRGEWVYRLSCNHLIHTECYHQHYEALAPQLRPEQRRSSEFLQCSLCLGPHCQPFMAWTVCRRKML